MRKTDRQPKNILIFSLCVAAVLIFVMLYQSSGMLFGKDSDITEDLPMQKVAILTSDKIRDQSWGSLAYRGQLKIEEEFDISTLLVSDLNTQERMLMASEKLIREGVTLFIGHGREFSESFTYLAEKHPDVFFVTLHGMGKHKNQAVYTYDQRNLEYFLALAASMKSKTKKIGVLESTKEDKRHSKFKQGLAHYAPEAKVHTQVVNSRDDGRKAVELMEQLLQKDVDVIYSKGNAFNQDVIDHAKKKGVYVIGYLDDQSYMAKDLVLTSLLNNVTEAYIAIMNDYLSEKGIKAGINELTEEDGVYQLAPLGPMFTHEEVEYIMTEIDKFNAGQVSFEED
ncbi:BMP family ABC transporter substrate-binding protein [Salipaludibacillus sp. LMS25]|jgi:transcriptional activator of comK gene|uniref:BMP family ABC transporter substrate-binding protein n=1 Tax=Salipaludibacillus sp. LMS25 TaxID=2924031 RepID=UPI0020D159B4|nr:BMP family ABC transporter substrate-binding protein [Salipaludibacillus sp. LMS25]UTR16112.1 BMP family ABC transporter substrate-binding protein [Salipaludibacillus sp. LMS25]